jgi:hypothetical protein
VLARPTLPADVFGSLLNFLLSDRRYSEVSREEGARLSHAEGLEGQADTAWREPIEAPAARLSPPESQVPAEAVSSSVPGLAHPKEPVTDDGDEKRETLLQKLGRLTPVQKICRAFLGSQEERFILIRDANKAVARSVLHSPKISDSEIEVYASLKSVTDEVLRHITTNRRFMKNYTVVRNLAGNPKAPIDVSLPLIKRLNDRDLKLFSMDKNIPDTVRTTAAKLTLARQRGKG